MSILDSYEYVYKYGPQFGTRRVTETYIHQLRLLCCIAKNIDLYVPVEPLMRLILSYCHANHFFLVTTTQVGKTAPIVQKIESDISKLLVSAHKSEGTLPEMESFGVEGDSRNVYSWTRNQYFNNYQLITIKNDNPETIKERPSFIHPFNELPDGYDRDDEIDIDFDGETVNTFMANEKAEQTLLLPVSPFFNKAVDLLLSYPQQVLQPNFSQKCVDAYHLFGDCTEMELKHQLFLLLLACSDTLVYAEFNYEFKTLFQLVSGKLPKPPVDHLKNSHLATRLEVKFPILTKSLQQKLSPEEAHWYHKMKNENEHIGCFDNEEDIEDNNLDSIEFDKKESLVCEFYSSPCMVGLKSNPNLQNCAFKINGKYLYFGFLHTNNIYTRLFIEGLINSASVDQLNHPYLNREIFFTLLTNIIKNVFRGGSLY